MERKVNMTNNPRRIKAALAYPKENDLAFKNDRSALVCYLSALSQQ
jgi:hypothetical protein